MLLLTNLGGQEFCCCNPLYEKPVNTSNFISDYVCRLQMRTARDSFSVTHWTLLGSLIWQPALNSRIVFVSMFIDFLVQHVMYFVAFIAFYKLHLFFMLPSCRLWRTSVFQKVLSSQLCCFIGGSARTYFKALFYYMVEVGVCQVGGSVLTLWPWAVHQEYEWEVPKYP